MLKRGDKLDKAFEELQTGMLDVLDEDLFSLPDTAQPAEDTVASEVPAEDGMQQMLVEERPEPAVRLTS
jgi:hypothetical protein